MTRREFWSGMALAAASGRSPAPLVVPVHLVADSRAKWNSGAMRHFWWNVWPEAVKDFGRCGVRIESSFSTGVILRPWRREPVIAGLEPGVINLVITDQIPAVWDGGLALSGVTTRYHGYHMCMVAADWAHGHCIPFLSTNTCVHEILHALLQDIFESRPGGLRGEWRELRVDYYATRLWLFHDGKAIRRSAQTYLTRLRSDAPRRD
jgi:hypothetical protein